MGQTVSYTQGRKLGVSAKEAFMILGIPASTGYRLIETGVIPAVRLTSRKMIVPLTALEKLIANEN